MIPKRPQDLQRQSTLESAIADNNAGAQPRLLGRVGGTRKHFNPRKTLALK